MPLKYNNFEEDDNELIVKICAKDKGALEQLYERNVGKMLGLATQILKSKSDAEDIIHDVIIEVWNKAKAYDSNKASVLGWLLLRVRSRCLDRIRKQQTIRKYAEKQNNEEKIQSVNCIDAYTDHKFLNKALNTLSENQRLVIELSYFKGFTCAEIAQDYGIALGTVKTRLLTAMKKMQSSSSHIKRGL